MTERLDPMNVLAAARQIEVFGIEFYRRFSECVREENGAALLRGLERDEVHHKEFIEKEMRRLVPSIDPAIAEPGLSLEGLVPDRVFQFPSDRCLSLEDEVKALEVGIQVEISSVAMYREAALRVDDPGVKALLEKLTHVEEGHRKQLEDNMYLLKNEGAWYGYSPILEG
jgi:rubrerythrin